MLPRLVLTIALSLAATSCGSDDSTDATPGSDAAVVDSRPTDTKTPDSATTDARTDQSTTMDARTADSAIGDALAPDSAPLDATTSDSAATDTRNTDSALADSALVDTGTADSATADSALVDSWTGDSATGDSATVDIRTVDAAVTDTWTADSAGSDGPDSADVEPPDGAPADTTDVDAGSPSISVTLAGTGPGTVTSNPAGIDCGSTCAAGFNYGENVTLTALPGPNSTFTGWSGSGCAGTLPCTISVTGARAVIATFALDQHMITVAKDGNGAGTVSSNPAGINCGPTCAANFNYGQDVTLTASPSTGSSFTGWSGSGCMGTTPCTVSVTAASSVTATFTLLPRTLTVNMAGTGTGTVVSNPAGIDCGMTCSATYNHGTVVSVYAISGASGAFMGWSGSCNGTGGCSITMNSSRSVTATFAPPLSCTTVNTVFSCSNGSIPQINLGQIAPVACHDQCQIAMRQAGMTTGCWIFAGDGRCYCRSGSVSGGGSQPGGFCN